MGLRKVIRDLLNSDSRSVRQASRRGQRGEILPASESLESRQLLTVISEINFDPLFGSVDQDQYFELRGTPGEALNDGTYFVVVDSGANDTGEINSYFDLSGLEIGANGYLVVSQADNTYTVDSNATHVTPADGATETGFTDLPGDIFHNDGSSGRFEFGIRSNSYFLIESDVEPTLADDIDAGDDGTLGGAFDNWTVLDSIAVLTNEDEAIGYADIVFRYDGAGSAVAGATVVDTEIGADYVARYGNSTGSTADDWVAGNVDEEGSDTGFFRLTHGGFGDATQLVFSGRGTNHVGSANFFGNISGQVFLDTNGNGTADDGEDGVEGVTLFADRNNNGVQDDVTFTVEPDDFEIGDELTNVASGMTMIVTDTFDTTGFVVRPQEATVPDASTGELVFAHEGVNYMSTIRQMRLDFDKPAKEIAIDVIGNSDQSDTYGRIEAFNANDESLGILRTDPLGLDQIQRLVYERDTADIAYAFIHSDDEFMDSSPFGRFDNLTYVLPEESVETDENGRYEFSIMSFGEYDVHVVNDSDNQSVTTPDAGENLLITFNEQLTADFGIQPNYDLAVSKTDGLEEAAPGDELVYTIEVSGDAVWDIEGVGVLDTLPTALFAVELVEVVPSGGATTRLSNGTALGGALTDTVDLPAGSSVTYIVQGTVLNEFVGDVVNTVELELPEGTVDLDSDNNTATDTTNIPVVNLGISTGNDILGEDGGQGTIVITRDGTTNGDLEVTISSSDPGIVSVPNVVIIPDGENSVEVEIEIIDDVLVNGDQEVIITIGAVFGVPLEEKELALTIKDDEVAGFTLTPTDGNTTVDETGATDTVDVALVDKPLGDVVLTIESGDETEATADLNSLTFTPDNWDAPQTLTITGVDDSIVDGTQTFTFNVSVDTDQSDANFADTPAQDLVVANEDDEVAGFTIQGENTTVTEAGTTDTVSIALDAEPTGDVVLNISGGDSSEVTLGTSSLTFTPQNWNFGQLVPFTGVNDDIVDGDQTVEFDVSVDTDASSEHFADVQSQTLEVVNEDDDEAGVDISITGTMVSESGGDVILTVVLTKAPVNQVVFEIQNENTDEVEISTNSLAFTGATWDTPQEVFISGLDDDLVDGDQSVLLTVIVVDAQTDTAFQDLEDSEVEIINQDDDEAGVTISETDGSTNTSEDGGTDSVFVVLDAQPSMPVVVTATFDDTEISLNRTSLTFIPNDWNTPQELLIGSVDDLIADGDQFESLLLAVEAGTSAPEFVGAADTVFVNSIDDDKLELVISETDDSTNVSESGESDSVSVSLASQPASDVVVTVNPNADLDSPSDSLTFNIFNWNTPQIVVIEAVDNDTAVGATAGSVEFKVDAANSDPAWAGVEAVTVTVAIENDDVAGIALDDSGESTSTEEGGVTDTILIELDSEPTGDVILDVSISNDEVSASESQVTITADNWNVPTLITLTANDDQTVDGDQISVVTLSVNANTAATEFLELPDAMIEVQTVDNDVAAFTLSETDGSTAVSEDGQTDVVTVVLEAQPLTDVVFDVSVADSQVATDVDSLTFTPDDWNVAQEVEVSAIDDSETEDPTTTEITVSINADLTDDAFDELAALTFAVTTEDNDEMLGRLDVDGDGGAAPLTDGILALRYLASFTGDALIQGAVGGEATRDAADDITAWLDDLREPMLDVDGDGQLGALTDGILIIRYLAGFLGDSLINDAVAPGATRTTADEIIAHLDQFYPAQSGGSAGGAAAMNAASDSNSGSSSEEQTAFGRNSGESHYAGQAMPATTTDDLFDEVDDWLGTI